MLVNSTEVQTNYSITGRLPSLLFCLSLSLLPIYRQSCPRLLLCRFLTPEDFSRAACVCRRWRGAVESDEKYWEQHCEDRFALPTPKAFNRERVRTWR